MAMKSFTREVTVKADARMEFRNLTPDVRAAVAESGVKEGLVLVNSMHTSSSVFVDDADEALYADLEHFAARTAPWDPVAAYKHNTANPGEENGAAHLQRAVFGREVVVAITAGALHLGKWESILYGEFDGKRAKKILIKVIGE
jgi:secondary thiamine-phosphate synthase enzyme